MHRFALVPIICKIRNNSSAVEDLIDKKYHEIVKMHQDKWYKSYIKIRPFHLK